ncbi:porin family protein [Paracoccus sp. Z330]|uniref:Porin family protein n=1 Tax=Paracoccus onchidii TaxID=3017813 RepID=A0ABT4ZEG3_9RHOB|nr:porin family protein [Paracoccus onchidii]MDB6177761.1 porin family protein [Paracoccus onchidii]
MKLVIAAVTSSLIAGSAYAGGYAAPTVEPSPEPVTVTPIVNDPSDWTGFYAGLQYGQGNAEFNNGLGESDTDAYGVFGGYNYDLGNWVVGGELDYNKIDADDLDDKGDLVRLRARAGYDLGKFMPYVTLGAAHLSQDIAGGDISETDVTYGIGAEYKVTERFTVGAEYTKQDFGDVADVNGLDLDTDMVQMRAAFRF